jgi:hypothetical protein
MSAPIEHNTRLAPQPTHRALFFGRLSTRAEAVPSGIYCRTGPVEYVLTCVFGTVDYLNGDRFDLRRANLRVIEP